MTRKVADIVEPLRHGLRHLGRPVRNSFQLVECDNLAVYPDGCTPFDEVVDPFNATVTAAWPYPQLFKGTDAKRWLLTQTTVSTINTSANPWTVTPQTTYDFATPASTKALTGDGIWHMADFGRGYMFFNGTVSLIYFPDYNAKYLVDDTVGVDTGCRHRGRLLLGGLNSFFTSDWDDYLTDLSEEYITGASHSLTSYGNQVWFSSPDGSDVLWPYALAQAKQGRFSDGFHNVGGTNMFSNFPMMMEHWKQNGGGIITMSWPGSVLCVKPLDKYCMVYGDKGISALVPLASPVATYGEQKILEVGIAGRGCVAGDDRQHVFLDEDGYLWSINADLSLQRLDYQEFLNPLLGSDPAITFDSADQEYFIATASASYLLTKGGLSRVYQSPTGLIHEPTSGLSSDAPYGVVVDNNLGQDALIKTDIFDFSAEGMKTIKTIDLGSRIGDSGATVTVNYRTDMDDDMNAGTETTVDDTGRATLNVSGLEFELEVKLNAETP